MVKRLFVLAAVTALAVAGVVPSVSATHSWGGYHWARTANPFTLALGDNLTSDWDPYLDTTSADWSQSSVLDTTVVAGGTTGRRCRPTQGRVEVCNAAYGQNGWLGLAQVWLSGPHITQGTAKMNDSYFKLAAYNTPAEKNHVMCQEVGHTFGLDHQDESGASLKTCMDYADDSTNSQHPNAHDYAMLETIYAHVDSTTTVGSRTRGAARVEGLDDVRAWGRQVSSAASGKTALYVRDLGQGQRVFTFVYWA